MIDWRTIKDETSSIVALLADIAPDQVIWRDESEGTTFQREPVVYLSVNTVARQGIEEERIEFVNEASNQVVNVCGQRRFMLSIRAESFDQGRASPNFAGAVCERIQTRLRRSSTLARLSSFAIETQQPINFLEYRSDGRLVSAYVLDIQCRTVDNDLDMTTDAGGWIGEAQISGTIAEVGGATETVTLDVNTLS